MAKQLAFLFLLGFVLCSLTDAQSNVDKILDTVKDLIRQMVPNAEMRDMFLSRVDEGRECLELASGINPDVVKKLIDGIIPTAGKCAAKTVGVSDPAEKKAVVKACFKENAEEFKKSSGMTADELEKFEKAGMCLQDKFGV